MYGSEDGRHARYLGRVFDVGCNFVSDELFSFCKVVVKCREGFDEGEIYTESVHGFDDAVLEHRVLVIVAEIIRVFATLANPLCAASGSRSLYSIQRIHLFFILILILVVLGLNGGL